MSRRHNITSEEQETAQQSIQDANAALLHSLPAELNPATVTLSIKVEVSVSLRLHAHQVLSWVLKVNSEANYVCTATGEWIADAQGCHDIGMRLSGHLGREAPAIWPVPKLMHVSHTTACDVVKRNPFTFCTAHWIFEKRRPRISCKGFVRWGQGHDGLVAQAIKSWNQL